MGWLRNYGAMADAKLIRSVKELQRGYGEACRRVDDKGGVHAENLAKAEYEARKRGLIDSTSKVAAGTAVFTEAKFCPECEKKRKFYLDDYVCKECRETIYA